MPALTVSRKYLSGDLIHREEPFVQILPKVFRNQLCESCHCRAFNLRACKQCLVSRYCGRPCQKKDWNDHRLECKHMKNLTGEGDDIIRLLGRIILKIKDKDWKSLKVRVLGTEVSFDDMDSHYKDMTEIPDLNLMYKEMKERVKNFIGVGNMPSDIDLVKITGKVMFNTFLNREKSHPGVCFFIGMSMFEHECIPNASFFVDRGKLKVWASKRIDKGSEKITVSFRRLFDPDPHVFYYADVITCSCSDCSLPHGDGALSQILDEKRAFGVINSTRNFLKIGTVLEAFEMESGLKFTADQLLLKHSGVLGKTNILHLKLLGFRCFQLGGHPLELKGRLLELESIMSPLYGEYCIEMLRIYETLAVVYLHLGDILLGRHYFQKVAKIANIN